MPDDVLVVLLEGRPIGELERRRNGSMALRFESAYLDDAAATPLSLSMPHAEERYGDAVVTPWLWGLLPDNADVLNRWGRDFGVSTSSPYPLLGTQVGHDCAGAVQFCPPDELEELLGRPGEVEWLDEREIAGRIRTLRADSTSWLGPGFTGQFSLGGAQAKTALHRGDEGWGVATGSVPTTHILKPAVAGYEAQHLNEHICLSTARALGLPAATTSIESFEEETAVVVERFDRTTRGGTLVRVHQEDLCQALSVPPARKYQADGGPTPAHIAELIRTSIPGADGERDVWRFVDALAFNWLIAGTDAHAKNYGLLLAGRQVRLAPLYDVSSFLPYDDSDGHRIKLAMKVGDDYKLPRTDRRSAWVRAARELRLDPDRVIERVVDLAGRAPGAVSVAAEKVGSMDLGSELPERLAGLIADRCHATLRSLG